MATAHYWSEWANTVATESQGCVGTSTAILQMIKRCQMADWHKMTTSLDTAGSHPQADQGETAASQSVVRCDKVQKAPNLNYLNAFLDADPLMTEAVVG